MIWLSLRRHRTNLLIATGIAVALSGWMVLVAHGYDTASTVPYRLPDGTVGHVLSYEQATGVFRLRYQTEVINFLLIALPAVLGAMLGVPLVAGELDDRTNRLAWTQQISRTRWLGTKWWSVGLPLIVLSALLALVAQWWYRHVAIDYTPIFGPTLFGQGGRMQPEGFSITGVVPIAYTAFAFSLGAMIGVLLRRVTWAIFGTLVVYAIVSLVMVSTVRPDLAPRTFVPFNATSSGVTTTLTTTAGGAPWYIGFGYQFARGSEHSATESATAIATRCEHLGENVPPGTTACLESNHIEQGDFFQPATNYWTIQWRESLLLLSAALVFSVVAWWLVRRWRS